MARMEWENLTRDECPRCGCKLATYSNDNIIFCANEACNFVVTKWKKQEILDSFEKRKAKREMEGFGFDD